MHFLNGVRNEGAFDTRMRGAMLACVAWRHSMMRTQYRHTGACQNPVVHHSPCVGIIIQGLLGDDYRDEKGNKSAFFGSNSHPNPEMLVSAHPSKRVALHGLKWLKVASSVLKEGKNL